MRKHDTNAQNLQPSYTKSNCTSKLYGHFGCALWWSMIWYHHMLYDRQNENNNNNKIHQKHDSNDNTREAQVLIRVNTCVRTHTSHTWHVTDIGRVSIKRCDQNSIRVVGYLWELAWTKQATITFIIIIFFLIVFSFCVHPNITLFSVGGETQFD